MARPFASRRYVLPSCTLEKLTRPEAQDLAEILVTIDPWRTLGYRAEVFAAYLARPDSNLRRFAIRSAGDLAGAVCLRYPWLRGVYLETLAIFPPHQGAGLGQEVMAFIERQARPHTKNFWTAVSSFNQRARRFYESLGFVETAQLQDLVTDGYDEILLRKVMV